MEQKIMNVGFIGCGGFIQGNHLPNVKDNPRFKIKGICDINQSTLDKLKESYAPDYFTTDFEKICSDPEVELVVIGTSPKYRYDLIKKAAENQKNLFVEKPMAESLEEARKIVDVVRKHAVRLMVGMNRPYSEICQYLKKVYTRVKKGQTLISYRIVSEDILWPQFHRDALEKGESTIVHESVHIFDLLNWLTDEEPVAIYCTGGRSDNNIISITYPDETEAVIISGGCGTEGHPKERMEIFTDHKVITMDEFIDLRFTRVPGEKDRFYPLKFHPSGNVDNFTAERLREELMAWRDGLTKEQIDYGYYYDSRPSVDKGHRNELNIYYDLIRAGKPSTTNEIRGLMNLVMTEAALESLKNKQRVELDFS